MGAQGPAGVIGRWMSYRDFWFESGEAGIRPSDTSKVSEIAAYIKQNPSLQVGIDTFMDSPNQDLRDRRVNAVRDALIQAGVPAEKIWAGAFGDPKPRRNARVEVLISTSQN
jgi:outer membrane protein OmpA-like peptidoglycan-associated protein